ncbi:UDP-N-acetylmuramoyl-L-alanine--D-glutamate ligase [Curvivirga aplysinae]|uniref:UDP-N-acetylmuramoyl-L-alanine--D-glutamate ligase n=1 Tax=Curvivirga aplysinae TaxID=2529852 RepID=UPI0012BBEFBD|nr:UDP-N-acetylmuramoyl-L-alanine--D-glutamate ligase [Curvivirga aplysinae]MTI10783.1 UDP-N-acetylmuramoyl-L-alanine--D-glutamate ligase [Curvivirga aplysinae]
MAITVTKYTGQTVAVMGLGRSGLSAVAALCRGGANVICWDEKQELRQKAEDCGATCKQLTDAPLWQEIVACVWSPGIPHTLPQPHPVAELAKANNIPLMSDISLLKDACPLATFIGITGTNGKSTTTALVGHILKTCGAKVQIGGNLGIPVLDLEPLGNDGVYVLEMSSYQIELTPSLPFNISVLLNISPDHLDRHGGMDGYVQAKLGLFDGQNKDHTAIIAVDDDRMQGLAASLFNRDTTLLPVSSHADENTAIYVKDNHLFDAIGEEPQKVLDLSVATTLPGNHNQQNAAISYAICRRLGLDAKSICDAICNYPGLPHRQQMAAILDNVAFVNDSKATNAEATAKALACYPKIYWIAGGVEKDGGYDLLEPYIGQIQTGYFIGEAAKNLNSTFADKFNCENSGDMENAVKAAFEQAKADQEKGAVVLLSPACASFDQFTNFETRGKAFCDIVKALPASSRQILIEETA